MTEVVVVKFKKGCKPYYFGAGGLTLAAGQGVIVETARGTEYAIVVDPLREVSDEAVVQPLKNIIRVATERDEAIIAEHEARRGEAMKICKEKIAARELPMKLIDCEFTFDGSKVVFTFTSEGRVDFRELVRDLASVFHLRIELRQVGIRDEARILGGIAPCGREVCCAGCMPDFKKVGIKMAKNQGLSLNPGKISGLCGRLMCCLAYEDDYYSSACKQVPRIGATVSTPEGKGTVISANMLKMEVRVKIEKDGALVYRDFPADQVQRGEHSEPREEEENAQEEPIGEQTAPAQEEAAARPERKRERDGGHDRRRNDKDRGAKPAGERTDAGRGEGGRDRRKNDKNDRGERNDKNDRRQDDRRQDDRGRANHPNAHGRPPRPEHGKGGEKGVQGGGKQAGREGRKDGVVDGVKDTAKDVARDGAPRPVSQAEPEKNS